MIGFIGWGHVGRALGHYLLKQGLEKVYFFEPFACEVDELYQKRSLIERMSSLEELVESCSILFVTVPDEAIGTVCQSIAKRHESLADKLFIHTSGAHAIDLMEDLGLKNAELASIHPLMAFNDHELAVKNLETAYLTVERQSDSKALDDLLKLMGNKIIGIRSDKKALYHAGACVLSNYLTVVMSYGLQMIEEATGGSESEVLEAAFPLVSSALDNIKTLGPGQALTGPLKRQDIKTIHKHYEALGTGPKAEFYHQLVQATLRYMNDFNYPHERLDKGL